MNQDNEFVRRLASDLARVVADYRAEHRPDATAAEVVAHTRAEVGDHDIDILVRDGLMDRDLAESYRAVLDAAQDDVESSAVTGHADGIVNGAFSSWYDGPSEADDDGPAPAGDLRGGAVDAVVAEDERGGVKPYHVHVKTELGRDDSVYVEAESEHAAMVAAMAQHPTAADVIDVYPADPVVREHDADAAVACARAMAAVAEAAARARARGDEDAVGVVVVEDVEAACDEDGGF
jgi:hypothetical protein